MNTVGNLKPGATYIYERADGVTYAREMGSDPKDRFEVGRDYRDIRVDKIMGVPVTDVAWVIDMIGKAKTNPALQDALERARILYELTREHKS
jgi:ornithine cyclodeaminase/alanine dehydrogenase-like protein (mu-crystallin family)